MHEFIVWNTSAWEQHLTEQQDSSIYEKITDANKQMLKTSISTKVQKHRSVSIFRILFP